jgi:hypothetical protein
MAGACGYLLIALYFVYDLQLAGAAAAPLWQRSLRKIFMPAQWVGLNTSEPLATWPPRALPAPVPCLSRILTVATVFIYLLGPSGSVFQGVQNWVYFNSQPDDNLMHLFKHYVFCNNSDECLNDNKCAGHGMFFGYEHKWCSCWWTIFRIAIWCCVAGCVAPSLAPRTYYAFAYNWTKIISDFHSKWIPVRVFVGSKPTIRHFKAIAL